MVLIIVPRYLYCWTTLSAWPWTKTEGIGGGFFLKSMILCSGHINLQECSHQSLKSSTTGLWLMLLLLSRDTITSKSSANLITCLPSLLLWHALVYETNKSGERTPPWGELVEDKSALDKTPFTLTLWDLSVKKSTSQHIKPWSMMWRLVSQSDKMWGWIQSKAEEKSIKQLCKILYTIQMAQDHVEGVHHMLKTPARPIGEFEWVQ